MDDLRNYLLGVLAEITAYFVIKAIEKARPHRKSTPKHMRRG